MRLTFRKVIDADAYLIPGWLRPGERAWIRQVLADVNQGTWEAAAHLPVTHDGRTLWNAVRHIDPAFTAGGTWPAGDPWPQLPTRETVRAALRLAASGEWTL